MAWHSPAPYSPLGLNTTVAAAAAVSSPSTAHSFSFWSLGPLYGGGYTVALRQVHMHPPVNAQLLASSMRGCTPWDIELKPDLLAACAPLARPSSDNASGHGCVLLISWFISILRQFPALWSACLKRVEACLHGRALAVTELA